MQLTYKNKKSEVAARWNRENRARRNERMKKWARKKDEYIDEIRCLNPCCLCGESDPECLDFHHKDMAIKSFGISAGLKGRKSRVALTEEILKCVVVCANCHRRIHSGWVSL